MSDKMSSRSFRVFGTKKDLENIFSEFQNNNIIKYGAVLITGFPCLAVMPEKFTPLPRPIIRSHMSGSMTLYNERLSIASLIKGLATRCRFRLIPV